MLKSLVVILIVLISLPLTGFAANAEDEYWNLIKDSQYV